MRTKAEPDYYGAAGTIRGRIGRVSKMAMGRIGQAALGILHSEGSVRMKRVRGMAVGFETRPSRQRLSQAQAVFKEPGVQCAEIRKPPKRCMYLEESVAQTISRKHDRKLFRAVCRGKRQEAKSKKRQNYEKKSPGLSRKEKGRARYARWSLNS